MVRHLAGRIPRPPGIDDPAGGTHLARIRAAFGPMQLGAVRPSHVRTWCAQLSAEGLADSYVYSLHARLAQLFADAVHDGLVARSPCSRRTSPKNGKQRPYVATTEQVWALHDLMPPHLRPTIMLGAFVGLRLAETCGLRTGDIDFMRGVVHPALQYPGEPLKTETSRTGVPIPPSLALELAAHVRAYRARGSGCCTRSGATSFHRGRSSDTSTMPGAPYRASRRPFATTTCVIIWRPC